MNVRYMLYESIQLHVRGKLRPWYKHKFIAIFYMYMYALGLVHKLSLVTALLLLVLLCILIKMFANILSGINSNVRIENQNHEKKLTFCILLNFLITVKAAPHECVYFRQGEKLKMRCDFIRRYNCIIVP